MIFMLHRCVHNKHGELAWLLNHVLPNSVWGSIYINILITYNTLNEQNICLDFDREITAYFDHFYKFLVNMYVCRKQIFAAGASNYNNQYVLYLSDYNVVQVLCKWGRWKGAALPYKVTYILIIKMNIVPHYTCWTFSSDIFCLC